MDLSKKYTKWIVPGTGAFIIFYCVLVLGYVATSPDVGLRCLLADQAGGMPGVRIRDIEDLECKGPQPEVGDTLLRIGKSEVNTFLDFTSGLSALRNAPIPPGGQLDPGADPSELGQLLPELVEVEDGQRLVRIEFSRPGWQSPQTSWLLVQSLPLGELILSFVWFLLQLGIFLVGALSVWHRPFDRSARLFFAMCVVTLGGFVGGYHWWLIAGNLWLDIPFTACAVLVPAVSLHFFLIYPRRTPPIAHYPRLTIACIYAIPVMTLMGMLATISYAHWMHGGAEIEAVRGSLDLLRQSIYAYMVFAAACFASMLVALAYGFFTTRNPIERNQMKWIFWAGMFAVIPVSYTLGLALFARVDFALGRARIPMFLASLSFTLAYAVGMIRFKLMLVDQIVSKGMVYYLASSGLTILYGSLIAISSLVANHRNTSFWQQQALQQALLVALILILVVILLLWLRDRFQQIIDRRFYREKYQLDKALQRMNRAVGHLVDRQSLSKRMLSSCRDALRVESAALYLRDSSRGPFQLIAAENSEDIPLQFSPDEPFITALKQDAALQRANPGSRASNSPEQNTLRLLRTELVYALELDGDIAGLVVLGHKTNGASYTAEDLTFLNALGQITSVALHSAKVHQDIARLNEELELKVDKISEQKRQIAMMQAELSKTEAAPALPEPTDFRRETIKGNSPAIQRVLETVRKVATSESSVLIHGASGTGKELLAQALHENSPRQKKPMVRVHCAALSPSLLESELFGHVKGAFTGAHRDRVGRFEMANGGTLFLDEIGDISLETQIKLLRVLQARSFEPVGGTRTVNVDVRLITATHQNLKKLIAEGRFREDLYYRLNVISITLPSLQQRKEDITELALHFLQRTATRVGKRITNIDEAAIKALQLHDWPGNIRELENTLERAVVLAEGEIITVRDLPTEVTQTATAGPRHVAETKTSVTGTAFSDSYSDYLPPGNVAGNTAMSERENLECALRECGGNKAKAARLMGIPRSTFFSKLKKHSIA